jgi:two-component system sensor histidine kinase CpxA
VRSLFLRLLVSTWLTTTVLVGIFAAIHAWAFSSESGPLHRQPNVRAVELRGELALVCQRASLGDCDKSLKKTDPHDSEVGLYQDGTLVMGSAIDGADALIAEAKSSSEKVAQVSSGREVVAVVLTRDPSYVAVSSEPVRSPWMFFIVPETLPYRLGAIIVVTGLVSVLLARWLSRPLRTLRAATQKVAEGDLSVRVTDSLDGADDESLALGRDMDRMTERIGALLEAQRRLLRDVSHELRSPLARLGIALELVRRKSTPDTAPQFERIERETTRLNEMIGELLTLSRLEAAGAPEHAEKVDLSALAAAIVEDVAFEAEQHQTQVALDARPAVKLEGDRELLRRAIENVLRNAVRFTDHGSTIDVALTENDGAIELRVRDRGPGVPEEAAEKIFEPFYRVDTDRARAKGGTGIGLAITHRAVVLHGGTVTAKNAQGGGLEIVMRFPRATA